MKLAKKEKEEAKEVKEEVKEEAKEEAKEVKEVKEEVKVSNNGLQTKPVLEEVTLVINECVSTNVLKEEVKEEIKEVREEIEEVRKEIKEEEVKEEVKEEIKEVREEIKVDKIRLSKVSEQELCVKIGEMCDNFKNGIVPVASENTVSLKNKQMIVRCLLEYLVQ
jgi:uncharacterized coiled-coil DUF342 family protein